MCWTSATVRGSLCSAYKSFRLTDKLGVPYGVQKSEYAQENLDFYRAVLKYHQNPSPATCKRIADTFVRPNAARQINLDSETSEACLRACDECERTQVAPADLFDVAHDWIGNLLKVGRARALLVTIALILMSK